MVRDLLITGTEDSFSAAELRASRMGEEGMAQEITHLKDKLGPKGAMRE